jgi:hypothetical protein
MMFGLGFLVFIIIPPTPDEAAAVAETRREATSNREKKGSFKDMRLNLCIA